MRSASILRPLLRAIAILIAVAGAADPVTSFNRAPPPRVVVVRAFAAGGEVVQRAVTAALRQHADVSERRPMGVHLGCVPDRPCVVIADGSIDLDSGVAPHKGVPYGVRGGVPNGASVSLIRIGLGAGPNVMLSSAILSTRQHSGAAGSARVDITGSGVVGTRTDIHIVDGSAVVGSATHEWKSDGPASIDLPWWPIGDGARVLRVEAVPVDGEATATDNVIDTAVIVHSSRLPVLIFEPRLSWATTFVRRALEDDPRFAVLSRARLGPTITAGTLSAALDSTTLQSAAAVIVGAPDALNSAEVDWLDRYVRTRGGTLVLLPDRAPSGPSSRLFPGRWTEHLSSIPEAIGPLRATEILRRSSVDATDVVLGVSSGLPVVTVSATGMGRVVVAGAMDAWRYRDVDNGAFDRFWRAILVEAGGQGTELEIDPGQTLVAAGAIVPFAMHSRRMQPPVSETIRATAQCGAAAPQMIRMWPRGERGAYFGDWPVGDVGPCQLDISIADGPNASASLAVVRAPNRGIAANLMKLERLVEATGGVSVLAAEQQKVVDHLRVRPPGSAVRVFVRPMHSPWWIVPFAACLAGEWWLRRRDGLR